MTRPLTTTRLAGDLMLGSRHAAAQFANRNADDIRRRCHPIACDVTTRAALYDLDHTMRLLATIPRRRRRVA